MKAPTAARKGAMPPAKPPMAAAPPAGKVKLAAMAPSLGGHKKQTKAPVKTDRGSFSIKG